MIRLGARAKARADNAAHAELERINTVNALAPQSQQAPTHSVPTANSTEQLAN